MKKIIFGLFVLLTLSYSSQAQWTMVSASKVFVEAGGSGTGTFVINVQSGFLDTGQLGAKFSLNTGHTRLDLTSFTMTPSPATLALINNSPTSRTYNATEPLSGTYTITYTLTDNGSAGTLPITGINTYLDVDDTMDGVSYSMSNAGGSALPVTLVSFNAQAEGKVAQLTWKTSSESNSSHFEVQHSLSGKNWATVGTVKSRNKGVSEQDYSFPYTGKVNGKNYFRLKMVDVDGSTTLSTIRDVYFEGIEDQSITFGPNPTTDYFTINASDWASVKSVNLVDKIGRTVYTSGATVDNTISVKNLASGIYLLQVTNKSGEVSTKKVLVNR